MGRRDKDSRSKSSVSKTHLRKKANKDERKAVKKFLSDGKFDLPNYKKLSHSDIEWAE